MGFARRGSAPIDLQGAYLAQLAFCFCRAAVLDMHIEHPKLDDPKPGP